LLPSLKTIQTMLAALRERVTIGPRKKAVFYYASSSLVCQCLRFVGVLITTRAIAPDQFGLFAQAALVMSIGGLFREIGQSGALVAYQGSDVRYVLFNFQLNLLLGLAAATIIFGSYLTPALIPIELRPYTWILAAIALSESLTLTNSLMLQKQFRFRALGLAEVASLLIWLTTICLLVGRTSGFLVLLCAQLAEGLCRCLSLFFAAGLRFSGFSAGKDLRHYYFYQFARPVLPLIVVQGLLARIDYLLLSLFSTRSELGTYERLGHFTRIPISLTINLCDKVLMHSYSYSQNDQPALGSLVKKSMLLIISGVILITVSVTAALLIFLKPLVGAEWAPLIMKLWWFGIPLILLMPVLSNITLFFSGLGMQVQLLRNTALNLLTDVVFGLLLVSLFGASGMLIAKSISGVFVLGYAVHALRRRLELPVSLSQAEQAS
jgi:O-antigen/teichoic acid export membrane protein